MLIIEAPCVCIPIFTLTNFTVFVYFNAFEMCTLYCYAFVIFQVDHTLHNANVLGDQLRIGAYTYAALKSVFYLFLYPQAINILWFIEFKWALSGTGKIVCLTKHLILSNTFLFLYYGVFVLPIEWPSHNAAAVAFAVCTYWKNVLLSTIYFANFVHSS